MSVFEVGSRLPWGSGRIRAWPRRRLGHGCGLGRCFAWASNCGDQDLGRANRYRGEGEAALRMVKEQQVRVRIGKADEAYRDSTMEERSR